ncbi:MAG: phosphoadenosine phosphosulfate reductase family protein [Selenomonadaceae bacterium]|nr:phosphoadenosine phosphosulfate reductase family protein [Selenomonadaceae bacterium]
MYNYEWDIETGGYNLVTDIKALQKELRPVFFEELKFLGLDKNFGWKFPESIEPLCWAEGRRYFYCGEVVAETQGGNLFEMPVLKNVAENLSLKPVDISAMVKKNSDLMNGLVQRTLKDIYAKFKSYASKVNIFYVAFSGGKDSLVMLDLVQRALPHDSFEVIFGDTSMELSDTYKAVDAAKNYWADLHWHTAKAPFDALESWKFMGPPAKKIRWCCSVHKSAPSLFKVKEIIAEKKKCSVDDVKNFKALAFIGVRAEESIVRANYDPISESHKHSAQINFYPIFDWTTPELFLYHFAENLPLNHSYRIGLHRVGCKFCPMSSMWTDCLQNHIYYAEISPFLSIVKESFNKNFETEEDFEDYLKSLAWKARVGGRNLKSGENKIATVKQDIQQKYIIKNYNYSWTTWMPALGDFIQIEQNRFSLQYEGESIILDVENIDESIIITLNISIKDKHMIHFMSLFRNALNKASYCKNCRVCMLECPHGALKITEDSVTLENCRHCHKCLEMPRGCWVTRSAAFGGDVDEVKVTSISRYQTFGLRADWIRIYFEDDENFWNNSIMGNRMFDSFKNWGREIELLDKDKNPAPSYKKFASLGVDSLKVWGIFWVNLAYNSPLINFFVKHVEFDVPCENDFLINLFGDSLKERTLNNALTSLKDTLKSSPIGEGLKQGICAMKGRQVISITRRIWENPERLVILYSLYKFAEKEDNYSFTLTNLLEDSDTREALSPKILFGLKEKELRPILQGLANDFSRFINVDFNKGIMENIFLNKEKTANDVIELF